MKVEYIELNDKVYLCVIHSIDMSGKDLLSYIHSHHPLTVYQDIGLLTNDYSYYVYRIVSTSPTDIITNEQLNDIEDYILDLQHK